MHQLCNALKQTCQARTRGHKSRTAVQQITFCGMRKQGRLHVEGAQTKIQMLHLSDRAAVLYMLGRYTSQLAAITYIHTTAV